MRPDQPIEPGEHRFHRLYTHADAAGRVRLGPPPVTASRGRGAAMLAYSCSGIAVLAIAATTCFVLWLIHRH